MRVALLSYECADYSIQLANGLAGQCDVLLMLSRHEAAEHQATIRPTVHFRPFDKPRLRQPIRQLWTASGLIRTIRRFRPDVVHLQHGHMWFNLMLPLLRSYPLVITAHDPCAHAGDAESKRTPQWITRCGYRKADRTIVHGEALKQQLIESIGTPAEKVHVVPHVAIGRDCAPATTNSDGKTILFFGRIWAYKGLQHFIEAEPLVTSEAPDAQFIIAGAGDDFEPYRRRMVHPERFEVHNRHITTSHRDELFERASVVVLPYIEATQSGVIPVAYSFAKPVVATRVGALAEAVEDGVTGLLVPPSDTTSLATAIVNVLRDPARAAQMGAAGRRKLDTEWSPSRVAEQTIEVYRRAIQDHSAVSIPSRDTEPKALEMRESPA
jgi:glycosyltransferase involved in cell wall biosynthesis